jgi:hypothetical protein
VNEFLYAEVSGYFMTVRTLTILLLFGLTAKTTVGQHLQVVRKGYPIYELETRLMNGDKSALFEISPYFDSKKKIIEFLGYHQRETVESKIAKRIVAKNTLFTEAEFKISDSSTAKQFTNFLNENKDKIVFSKLATSFLITPLDKRTVTFEIRPVSEGKKQELQNRAKTLLNLDWVRENKIDSLVSQKNSASLLLITSEFFKLRSMLNRYYFYEEEFINLLQYLTGTEIGVENERKKISWHIDKDYDSESKLNLLIYFAKYYAQYKWEEKDQVFVNPNHEIRPIGKEEHLFQLLNNKNDSIAIDAFTKLTFSNPTKVIQLAEEFHSAGIDKSYAIPTFPYKFLKQLVLLTDYCKSNEIDFAGTEDLKNNISLLQSQLSFTERRKLEDKLISSLTLDDITAFEYWALIYERSWGLTYSAGRILDIFYSKKWNDLLANNKYLSCYLKKSALFNNLGIIGVCNNYLKKFSGSSETTLTQLKTFYTSDNDVKSQIEKILLQHNDVSSKKEKKTIIWDGNYTYEIKNLKKQLSKLTNNVHDSSETEDAICKILSQINYKQIATALNTIEDYPFKSEWKKYSFMERDWGFFMAGNFDKKENRDEFLKLYSKRSQYRLYAYYLDKSGIDYTTYNRLDFDKIYELLKYNVVVAFVGGGGGKKDNEVYSLIKLLELTFKTTLGYPNKLCNSNNIYVCYSNERAKAWMTFLTEKRLLKQKHDEPISFNYE